jgi:hypothetical protein
MEILGFLSSSDCGYGILGDDTELSCGWMPTLWRKTLTPWARNWFSYKSTHKLQGWRETELSVGQQENFPEEGRLLLHLYFQ